MLRRALSALLAVGVAVALLLAFLYLRAPRATAVLPGQVAPELEAPYLEGGAPGKLSTFRGAPVLLVFFDTTCAGCADYVAELEILNRRYRDGGLVVMAVALDEDPRRVLPLLRRSQATFLVLSDPGGARLRSAWGRLLAPEAYVIDRQGRVTHVWVDAIDWRTAVVRDALRAAMASTPPRPAR